MKAGIAALVIGLVLSMFVVAEGVNAQSFRGEDRVTVAADEFVDGSLYAAGETVTIDGSINGDVYCAGQTVVISGSVSGDVLCAAQMITISGVVQGDVRLAAQVVTIEDRVESGATLFAQTVTLLESGFIGGDVTGAAQSVTIDGEIERDLVLGSETMVIAGRVGRNVNSDVERLSIESGATVGGNVNYSSSQEASVAGGSVQGLTTRTEPLNDSNENDVFNVGWFVAAILAVLLPVLALAALLPRFLSTITDNGMQRLGKSALIGFAALFVVPGTILLLMMTFVGILLAVWLLLLWIALLMLNIPVVGYYLGRLVLGKRTSQPVLIMLSGVSIILVTSLLPVLNILTPLAVAVIGTGMTLLTIADYWRKGRAKPAKVKLAKA